MIIDDIRAASNAEPFQPFALRLKDGRILPVVDAFHISIGAQGRVVSVGLSDGRSPNIRVEDVDGLEMFGDKAGAGATRRCQSYKSEDDVMLIEEIRFARRAEPFRPFAIQVKGGEVYPVTEPLHIAIDPDGGSISVALSTGGFELIETDMIECVRLMQSTHAS
jgi:hypothetical protein